MPELPEVETVKHRLHTSVKGKTIQYVEVLVDRIIRTPDVKAFQQLAKGNTIHAIERRGKHLIFVLKNGYIVSHLRMEGKFNSTSKDEERHKHDHIIFYFTDGTELRYNDVRKFGTLDFVSKPEDVTSVKELGLEPTDANLTAIYLQQQFCQKKNHHQKCTFGSTYCCGTR